jgi:hypothetical protein
MGPTNTSAQFRGIVCRLYNKKGNLTRVSEVQCSIRARLATGFATKTPNLNTDSTDLHGSISSPTRGTQKSFLSLVEIEEIARTYFESAGELKDVIETDILFTAFHFTDEIAIDLDHGAQLFLGQLPFRAYGTQTCAER